MVVVVNTAVRGRFISRSSVPSVRDICSFVEPESHRPSEADVCSASRGVLCGVWYTKVACIIVFITALLLDLPTC
jgi:hypothetical protein